MPADTRYKPPTKVTTLSVPFKTIVVRADPDFERPETRLNMMDDATDCLRYLTILGAHLIRQKMGVALAGISPS